MAPTVPVTSTALLDTIRKFFNKGKHSVANSIQKSSKCTYSTRWFQFVKELFGTDPFMRTVLFQYKRETDSFHHT